MFYEKSSIDLTNHKNTYLNTTKGAINAKMIKGILIHEHVFNKFPFRLREKAENFAINELENAYNSGINVIVDLTPYTNPYDYYRIIDESIMNIVTCIGFYTAGYMAPRIRRMTEEELIKTLSKKIEFGVGIRRIKPSILKVAVQKNFINDTEHRFMKVIGKLSKIYDLPVALHAPYATLNHTIQLINYGVTPSKLMVAHIEHGISKENELLARTKDAIDLAALGCYIQLADFGSGTSTVKCKNALSMFDALVEANFINNVLVSSDSNWRWKGAKPVLRNSNKSSFGRRFTYTLTHTIPLLNRGTEVDASKIFLYRNPLRYLCLLP